MSALSEQVAGNHYLHFPIQPIKFIVDNELSFLQGCIIKRICRYKFKGTKQDALKDLRKIQHECELIIELEDLECHLDE